MNETRAVNFWEWQFYMLGRREGEGVPGWQVPLNEGELTALMKLYPFH